MAKVIDRGDKTPGAEPGTLVYVGEAGEVATKIQAFEYTKDACQELTVKSAEECCELLRSEPLTWLDVAGLADTESLQKIGDSFGLHPLVLEDIANTHQRPKVEDYDSYVFLVMKMVTYDASKEAITLEQVSFILGKNFVISFQEDEGDVFDAVRQRLRSGKGKIRKLGPDYLLYCLMDAIVDHYFSVMEDLGESIDQLEVKLVTKPDEALFRSIHRFKRELIFLRRSVWPVREMVAILLRDDHELVTEQTTLYLRDLHDHAVQVADAVEALRDIVSSMLDVYLSSLSHRMNEVMKVLTVMSSIFIPLTFIAGVYGMNFEHMPELHWRYGYPYSLCLMACVGISLFVYFRAKKWI